MLKSLTSGEGAWTSKWLSGHDKYESVEMESGAGVKIFYFQRKGQGDEHHSQNTY
jgi:hypothetical protein